MLLTKMGNVRGPCRYICSGGKKAECPECLDQNIQAGYYIDNRGNIKKHKHSKSFKRIFYHIDLLMGSSALWSPRPVVTAVSSSWLISMDRAHIYPLKLTLRGRLPLTRFVGNLALPQSIGVGAVRSDSNAQHSLTELTSSGRET